MEFTYAAYRNLITELKQTNYQFCGYFDYAGKEKSVIMRHDIDYCLEQSVKMAQIEQEEGISSTYFVLLKTDFYNPASKPAYTVSSKCKPTSCPKLLISLMSSLLRLDAGL